MILCNIPISSRYFTIANVWIESKVVSFMLKRNYVYVCESECVCIRFSEEATVYRAKSFNRLLRYLYVCSFAPRRPNLDIFISYFCLIFAYLYVYHIGCRGQEPAKYIFVGHNFCGLPL